MGSTGSLQPETRQAWDAGALKYRWNGRTFLAYAEVTCLNGRVVDKTQAALGSPVEPLMWAGVLALGCLGGVLLWRSARGQRRAPRGLIRERVAMVLASWLIAFAIAPGVMSTLQAEGLYRKMGDDRFVARVWLQQGYLALLGNETSRARELIAGALSTASELGDRWAWPNNSMGWRRCSPRAARGAAPRLPRAPPKRPGKA
jgi:hypothetical protein